MEKEEYDTARLENAKPRRSMGSIENPDVAKKADEALDYLGDERIHLTEEDNQKIKRKTDKVVLVILVWVYFLQILDKSVLSYGAVFGLQKDTHMTGNDYSFLGSIAPIAQLGWQPFSSFLIVKVPHRILMPSLVLGWGIAQASMAACQDYGSLLAARFFLGLFEAGCLPLFSVITSQWYRRAEQPIRVAAWYGTNGAATIIAAALSYGLGHIKSDVLLPWQMQVISVGFEGRKLTRFSIFLFVGLITIVTAPFIYLFLPKSISTAYFLTPHERLQAIERLRANNTGTGTRLFKWPHLLELALEPKTYLFLSMTLLLNVGAQVSNTFGPLLLAGIGFDKYLTSLLNMPFGALQILTIFAGSWAAQRARLKSVILASFMLPVIAGLAILYAVPRGHAHEPALLAGYYLFAFLFAGNPLIVAWIVANTAGTTKKSAMMSVYQAASSAGNIIGPLLFESKDKPAYLPGLRAVLGIFVALVVIVIMQLGVLLLLNKSQEKRRVANGKAKKVLDRSMESRYVGYDGDAASQEEGVKGEQAFLDLTDRKNDEFVYVY
ncbi:MAG: hypothetical protein Q9227_001101 [Pyrenula ochraceoflavens]